MEDRQRQPPKKSSEEKEGLDARGITKQNGQGWGLDGRKALLFFLFMPEE